MTTGSVIHSKLNVDKCGGGGWAHGGGGEKNIKLRWTDKYLLVDKTGSVMRERMNGRRRRINK